MQRLKILITALISVSFLSFDFSEIDNVVSNSISQGYFPGAQVLIGNEKVILYEKSYGNFTYGESSPVVTSGSIFDIASITKPVATSTAIMLLYKNGKLDLYDEVSKYIPEFSKNGKEDIKIINLLLHNSGLKAWIPFYKTCISKKDVLNEICNLYPDYVSETKTVYSDLNAILLGEIAEQVSGQSLDEYSRKNIFQPLKMENTFFNPSESKKSKILPTENDTYWRMRQLQGEVHDETASLMGGVSGNAGLFSNAGDLYKFMKMMLNSGSYYSPYTRGLKEEQFCSAELINRFTSRYNNLIYYNTRALGWETKPESGGTSYEIPCGSLISENCFGHTGYTGTSIWCDKDRKLIIIFLTTRVYPSRDNNGIRYVRPEIHNKAIEIYATISADEKH